MRMYSETGNVPSVYFTFVFRTQICSTCYLEIFVTWQLFDQDHNFICSYIVDTRTLLMFFRCTNVELLFFFVVFVSVSVPLLCGCCSLPWSFWERLTVVLLLHLNENMLRTFSKIFMF
jgi:hypothetical protein